MFRNIKGQSSALRVLSTAIENDRVPQAYLFHGIDGVGKFTSALYFGMALNCLSKSEFRPCGVCSSCRKFLTFNHPDLSYIFPTPKLDLSAEGEIKKSEIQKQFDGYIQNKIDTPWQDFAFNSSIEIRIESIRMLIKRLDLSIYEANYRICIIEDADEMNTATANAFLKILEEPPKSTVIILLTSRLSMLLPTIISRCQPVSFQPVIPKVIEGILTEQFDIARETARTISKIADGSVKRAIILSQSDSAEIRNRAFEIFQMSAMDKDLSFYKSLQNSPNRLNAETVIELIRYICLFVSDLYLIDQAPELVVNIDKLEFLSEARAALSQSQTANLADNSYQFVLEMEDLKRKIYGNVNLQLVMVNLYMQLNKVFRI